MPFHLRRWSVQDVSAKDMAKAISSNTFVLCKGFRCDGILWLHDSGREGTVQEWATIRESDGRQLETITTGWLDQADDEKMILEYQAKFAAGAKPMFGEGQNLQQGAIEHLSDCGFCA